MASFPSARSSSAGSSVRGRVRAPGGGEVKLRPVDKEEIALVGMVHGDSVKDAGGSSEAKEMNTHSKPPVR